MFTDMINTLREGLIPQGDDLKRRLDLAIVKKGGILQQPKMCWSGDTKINPDSLHMLWAASILEDTDAMATVVGMIEMERTSSPDNDDLKEFLVRAFKELALLSNNPDASKWLHEKSDNALEKLGLLS